MSLEYAKNVQQFTSLPIRVLTVEADAPEGSNEFERAIERAARAQKAAEHAALVEQFGKARREDVENSVFE